LRLGLVNRVLDADRLLPEALRIAGRIASNAPVAVRTSLALARRAADLDETTLRTEAQAAAREVMATDDAREGARAFAERREPRWLGK
jgi:enoyl-CoA hydratase/carnithine racemase